MLSFCSLRQLLQFSFQQIQSIFGVRSWMQLLNLLAIFSYQSNTGEWQALLIYVLLSIYELLILVNGLIAGISIVLLLQQKIISLQQHHNQMDSNYQWIENKYQPGLFTFYLQEDSLCPPQDKYRKVQKKEGFNKRRFNSQVKIMAKERVSQRFKNFKITMSPKDSKMVVLDSKEVLTLNKSLNKSIDSQRLSTQHTQNHPSASQQVFQPYQTVKHANLNNLFRYDINKNRSKMFIYRGQTPVFVKKFSKRYHKNPQNTTSPIAVTSRPQWQFKNNQIGTHHFRQSIISDERITAHAKQKLNYLQFMMARNRQRQTVKTESNRKRIEMALTRLKQVKRPEMLEVPMRMVTDF